MSAEKVIKSKTFYIVMAVVVALFVWMLYTGSDVELYSATDTIVRRAMKINKAVVFAKQGAENKQYLADANGMALYTYAEDKAGVSNCTGDCLTTWPPYTVKDALVKTDGVATGTLATIAMPDGKLQVTYNGMPLYHYSGDTAAGELKGDGVKKVWSVAKP